MGKIQETLSVIQAGARTNKYRVLYPQFGNDIDIVCNATSMPGREIGTVDVFVKGRKYQIAGEMSDNGTWEITFYNTPDHLHRRFFLKMLGGMHNFQTPDYLIDGGSAPKSTLTGSTVSASGTAKGDTVLGILGNISGTVSAINTAYNDVRAAIRTGKNTIDNIKQAVNGDWNALESLVSATGYDANPWYQQDIIIQQLDHNMNVATQAILGNTFVTSVSPIEYTDQTGEVSTTTVTFAYSGVDYGSNTEIELTEKY